MKTKLLLLLALALPLSAREVTVTWDKHPEKVTVIILADGKEVGRKPVDPAAPAEDLLVTIPDVKTTLVAVTENAVGLRSIPSLPLVLPPNPVGVKGLALVVKATITITP